jgi:hypothetical protein
MVDEAQLQIHEFTSLTPYALTCTVRCVAGTVHLGDTARLVSRSVDRPIAAGLTISAIEYYGKIPMDFVDLGRTALVTATGTIDDRATRAAAAGVAPAELFRVGLFLTVP